MTKFQKVFKGHNLFNLNTKKDAVFKSCVYGDSFPLRLLNNELLTKT